MKFNAWVALAVTFALLVDTIAHQAWVASVFFVFTLRVAIVRVLRVHNLWGRG